MLAATKEIAATSEPKEAREMLGLAANEYPGSPEDASLGGIIAQDQLDRKSEAAAEALWRARYDRPEDPGSAVEQLAGLDLGGLPELLRGEVFCAWLQACRRLCQARRYLEPLFRATGAERGLVMARPAPGRPYVVVSALGMGPAVRPGDPVRHRALSRAWPLTPGRPGGGRPDRPGQRAAGRQDA
jgi:hypothetical protein